MKKKLSLKFILTSVSVLFGVFIITLVTILLTVNFFTRSYIRNSVRSFQATADKNITATVDEIAYFYARMVKTENKEQLDALGAGNSRTKRMAALVELAGIGGMNGVFSDVGWRDEGGFISLNGHGSPSDFIFNNASDDKNIVVMGGYENGSQIFMVRMKNNITETEGDFVFFLPDTVIEREFSDLGMVGGYSYIIRSDGYVVMHEDKEYTGKYFYNKNLYSLEEDVGEWSVTQDGERKIVLTRYMDTLNGQYNFDCYLVTFIDYAYYFQGYQTLLAVLIVIAVVIFLVSIWIAIIRARRINRPISRLNENIAQIIKTGDKGKVTAKEGDELYSLEQKYDEMVDRLFALMTKSREDADIQKKLELDALHQQINPHFLYNTLDAITWMAKIKKERDIEAMVLNLAQFFRL
ncbi:MAG: histidine kinase, partial [Clostridia bacterium]|nr:histidine kinase [Clostridia bacterium]